MVTETPTTPYIRPCAAFPDGWFFDQKFVGRLIRYGLIERDDWSENTTPNDYSAIYSDENMEYVADKIVRITNG
jgi:hypothetical protein